jgi:hypothetical protein
MLVLGYRSSDVGPIAKARKFLGGLINDAFQLFGAPGMPEAMEN